MPRKYQNGKLMTRTDVERPYYFIFVTIPRLNPETGLRELTRVRKILGFKDDLTNKQAMELRAAQLEEVNRHRTIAQSMARFESVARRFLEIRVPQLGAATGPRYKSLIDVHLIPYFGKMTLSEIDRPTIEKFLLAKSATLGWWSRISLKGVLSAIFTVAKDWKLFEGENPTAGVRIGRKRLVREKRLLKVDEIRMLLAALPERPKFIVLIMFGLGLRISEVLGLKWKDIDFDEKTLTVCRRWYRGDLAEETKTEASSATMRLGPSMLDEFQRRRGRSADYLFFADDGINPPDDRDLLREEFRPVLKRLKLYTPGLAWHAFRRANITYRQQIGGATPLEAQKAARHASLDLTYLYTLSDGEREASQQQAMFDKLMELPEGPKQ